MKLKRKVVATTLAASMVLSTAAFAPFSLTGGGKAYAASASLPAAADSYVERLNKVYANLSDTDKTTIRTARNQVNTVLDNDYFDTAKWTADQKLVDPIWKKIAPHVGSIDFTEGDLLLLVMHLAITYDSSYSDVASRFDVLRPKIDKLAQVAGATNGLNDSGLTVASLSDFVQSIEDAAIKQVTSTDLTDIKGEQDTIKTALKSVVNKSTNEWAQLFTNLGISADDLLAVRSNFENDSRFSSLHDAETALVKAYLKLIASQIQSSGNSGGNDNTGGNGNTGNQTGGVTPPPPSPGPGPQGPDQNEANNDLNNAAQQIAQLLQTSNNQEGLLKAQAAVEQAIRQAAQIDLSSTVKVDNGVAKPTIDVSKFTSIFQTVKSIADSADAKLKAIAPNAPLPEVVATLNLGNVNAPTIQIPLATDLITQAKANGIDALALQANGVSLTVPVDQIHSDTTVTIQKDDKSVATNVTKLPVLSDVYSFNFTADNQVLENFSKPIQIQLPIPDTSSVDTDLLTLAKIINGKLQYYGGRYDSSQHAFNATRRSFSTYTVVENKVNFADTTSVQDWAGRQIQVDAAKGIVEGRADGQFDPSANVTRAEFAKMLVKAFGLEDATATESFSDVNASDWFQPYVAAAVKAGIVNGRSADQFAPNDVVSRAEMATMAARALETLGYQPVSDAGKALAGFQDASSINSSLQSGVALAASLGVVIGTDATHFDPNGNSNRAQAAVLVYRLLSK